MFHSPIFWLFLFCLAGPQAVRTEPYNSTSSLTTSPDDVTTDLLVLASEETPTRAPRPVTKQGNAKKVVKVQKAEKKNEEEEDGVEDVTPSEDPLYVTDCSEPLNKDISCSVNIGKAYSQQQKFQYYFQWVALTTCSSTWNRDKSHRERMTSESRRRQK